jgi:hypothetical protein
MGQDMDDVDPLLIVPDLRDEAVFIASNVEDGTFSNRIGVREIEPCLDQVRPLGVFGDPIPIFERLFGVGMNFPKLAQSLPADDSHQYSFSKKLCSQFENWISTERGRCADKVSDCVRHFPYR